jgi:hypothetical protein
MTEKTAFTESPPSPGLADIRITAASPETARQVAEALRRLFAAPERDDSGPDGADSAVVSEAGGGTTVRLTVDTTRAPGEQQPFRPRLVADDDRRGP